ncbi:ArsR family transcriptional regulator [Nocardioides oleivorans]|uniref:ArsR family transcriptional regulator n=1 Tax=Nocardioides oleivorans TaxID=273676 RepID=A0A4Q2S1D0_9ACTN|nr:metalloregulator ArsR/SmtB family transcription factor [Nocardioides oleivorans]RYB94996.1 ArsR family transcriptional regulator [Nocardioides oleivorans]
MDPFAALADPVRRDLVVRLAGGPARVVDLTAEHAITRPAISRHLRLLTEAGLVSAEDHGRERHYRLERAGLAPVADLLAALRETPAPPVAESAFDGLDLEVRRTGRDRRTAPSSDASSDSPSTTQEDTA